MSTEFQREERYLVFKLSDVAEHFTFGERLQLARLAEVQRVGRKEAGKAPLDCVVVEADWPEYEPTWKAIEARMTGAQPAPNDEYIGWYCAHCERGVDASEVTYNEQHTVCGRVITDDKPPKPAPSMPTALLVAVANLVAQMEIVSRVGFVDTPNDKDSCTAFCVAEGTWLELMSAVESLAAWLAAASEAKPCFN